MVPLKIRRFGMIVFYLMILVGIVGCSFNSNYPQEDAEESVDSLLADLAVLATQTQQARENLLDQQSQTPESGGIDDLESPTPAGIIPGTSQTVLETIPEESLLTTIDTEINFKPGGTVAHIRGEISKGEQHIYKVGAAAGQTLLLTVSSDLQAVYLGLEGLADGQVLLPVSEKSAGTVVVLPSTQDYQVTVLGGQTSTIYFLEVEIPVDLDLRMGEKRILDGYIDVWEIENSSVFTRVRYLVYAEKGQVLAVKLDSPNIDGLNLGLDGQSHIEEYWRFEIKGVEGELKVDESQGYYLDVYALSGVSTPFTLTVELK